MSGTRYQEPTIRKIELPMKTEPVAAPRLPESVLYVYGTVKVKSHVVAAFDMTPIDCVFARRR